MLTTYGKGKTMNKLPLILKKHAPVVLAGAGAILNAGACIFSAAGALKAEKLIKSEKPEGRREEAKIYIRSYWPAALLFIGGTVSIIFSHKLSAKQIAGFAAAAVAAEGNLRKYRQAIKEKLGEEEEKEIYISKVVDADWAIWPEIPHKVEDYDDSNVFYDAYSDRFFVSSIEKVQQAMYHMNRNFVMRGWAYLNEWYEMLGLSPWSDVCFLEDYGMTPWIDFFTDIHENENGTFFYSIYADIEPSVKALERVFS